jgi:hypothetical protein
MKKLKTIHKNTELHIKIGMPIVALIIAPAVVIILKNICTIADRL